MNYNSAQIANLHRGKIVDINFRQIESVTHEVYKIVAN